MIDLIFLAGGKSSRMGLSTPKPFLQLLDKKVFEYSFEILLKHPDLNKIVVVVPDEFKCEFSKFNQLMIFAEPGTSRLGSVINGYQLIEESISSHVLIHDAARPFLNAKDLDLLIEKGLTCDGIGLAEKITSSIKLVQDQKIKKNLNRDDYVLMQTPQMIKKNILKNSLFLIEPSKEITDDLSLLEFANKEGEILFGSPYNFKLTYKKDLEYAEFLLKNETPLFE